MGVEGGSGMTNSLVKFLLGLVVISLTSFSLAHGDTHYMKAGQIYMGEELHNGQPNRHYCFIEILQVIPRPERGLHCFSVEYKFGSDNSDVPQGPFWVDSRITNAHRPEYPRLRSCAINVDGTSYGDEIYGDDTSILYNQIFAGGHNQGRNHLVDYFMALHFQSKQPRRVRTHITTALSERSIDCTRLELMRRSRPGG